MKNVLIVDDEEAFLSSAAEGLKAYAKNFSVYTAGNGVQAPEKFMERNFDLLVTDLKMPVMDGFELLIKVSHIFPRIPVIVITAFGTPEIEERLFAKGILGYLEKPLDIEHLADRIFDGLAVSSQEFIQEVFTLSSFMELIRLEKKTCTLVVKSKDRTGTLYFLDGELIDTEAGELSGEEAVYEIMDWDQSVINIFNSCDRNNREIKSPIDTIIKRKSERARPRKASSRLKQEVTMNIKKLQKAVDVLRENLGEGLMATDIWVVSDGTSIVGLNSQPEATAMFNQMADYLAKTLEGSGFPKLGKYFMVDLVGEKFVVVLPLGDFRWGMLIDRTKVQLGLVLSIAIPRAIAVFEEAITGQ